MLLAHHALAPPKLDMHPINHDVAARANGGVCAFRGRHEEGYAGGYAAEGVRGGDVVVVGAEGGGRAAGKRHCG